MKNTTNYNLKKPDLTDYVNVSDLNENADIIDNQLKANANALTAHQSDPMPHRFTDSTDNKTYKYGFKTNTAKDGLIFVYEEVTP